MSKEQAGQARSGSARSPQLTVEREAAILVGGYRPGDLAPGEEPLEELGRLAETAGARVVGKVTQHIREITPGTYIGSGKAQEVRDLARRLGVRCVIFDHDLTPAQGRNLDQRIGVKVVDRTDLILDIFASRARTRTAKVQVNLALFEYRLPRLRRLWTHLEKQEGGIGMRGGAGERQLETDRRMLSKQIRDLRSELADIQARKERQVRARVGEHFLISLVGYTNAGKSTLMHALTGEDVAINNQLFVTLDTRTARLRMGNGLTALLSDTVGFIRRLPHHLVASFHATLEEARAAELLLHVVDVSSPLAREQMAAVHQVLSDIGCAGKPVLPVFNKIDRLRPEQDLELRLLQREYTQAVPISALRRQGLEELKDRLLERARDGALPVSLSAFVGDGRAMSFLATHFFEDSREVNGQWITFHGRATRPVLERLRAFGPSIRFGPPSGGPGPGAQDYQPVPATDQHWREA